MSLTANWTTPPRGRPRISLLSSVDVVEEGDFRFAQGFKWEPNGCAPAGLEGLTICEPSDPALEVFENPAIVSTEAFGVYATDKCSGFSNTRDFEGRARDNLRYARAMWIERQLWENPLGLDTPTLATTDAVDVTPAGGAVSGTRALKILESELTACTGGGPGVIHAPIYTAGSMMEQSLLSKVPGADGESKLVSYMDTVVVPGAGYTGSGPDGTPASDTEEWVYASAPVFVRLGAVTVTPGSLAEAFDRSTNSIVYYAHQEVAVAFDPGCCVLAIRVTRT